MGLEESSKEDVATAGQENRSVCEKICHIRVGYEAALWSSTRTESWKQEDVYEPRLNDGVPERRVLLLPRV